MRRQTPGMRLPPKSVAAAVWLHFRFQVGLQRLLQIFSTLDSKRQGMHIPVGVNNEHRRGRRVEELVAESGADFIAQFSRRNRVNPIELVAGRIGFQIAGLFVGVNIQRTVTRCASIPSSSCRAFTSSC